MFLLYGSTRGAAFAARLMRLKGAELNVSQGFHRVCFILQLDFADEGLQALLQLLHFFEVERVERITQNAAR